MGMNTYVTAMPYPCPGEPLSMDFRRKTTNRGTFDRWGVTKRCNVNHLRIIPLKLMPMRPSRLVNSQERAAARRPQTHRLEMRQPPCRVGFSAWALAVQLRPKPLAGPTESREARNTDSHDGHFTVEFSRASSDRYRCLRNADAIVVWSVNLENTGSLTRYG